MTELLIVGMFRYMKVPYREIIEGTQIIRHYYPEDGKVIELIL